VPRPFVVLQSYQQPTSTTNPYIVLLSNSLAALPNVEVLTFTWRRALTARVDVFHMHWPEIRISGRTASRRIAQQVLFALLMCRLHLTRTAIVRTAHNLRLPEGISRRETLLLRLADRWTTLRIRLNTTTEFAAGQPFVTIAHGHYKDWFKPHVKLAPIPGRIVYFGLIRRYKGVEGLIDAFRQVPVAANLGIPVRRGARRLGYDGRTRRTPLPRDAQFGRRPHCSVTRSLGPVARQHREPHAPR